MERYLIDTNIISDYFSAAISTQGLAFMDAVMDAIPRFSVITQIELLCWKTDIQTEQRIGAYIAESMVFNISSDIIAQCVTLRRSKKIKTPDAIIAATALVYGFTLLTNNEKDFSNLEGLKLLNPHKL